MYPQRIFIIVITVAMLSLIGLRINAQGLGSDLLNLGKSKEESLTPYTQVKIDAVWDAIRQANPVLHPVTVGIVDSGIDADRPLGTMRHPEFEGVNLGKTPLDARRDSDELGHGTQVAGIIGANNISVEADEDYIFPHMNGILSGVKSAPYMLEVRREGGVNFFQTLSAINELAISPFDITGKGIRASVINLSFTFSVPDTLAPICEIVVAPMRQIFLNNLVQHPGTLFVVGAGETTAAVKSSECFIPGNLGNDLDNVITVSAVHSLGEQKDKRWSGSPFGGAVNIAAPGGDPVYAPAPRSRGNFPAFGGDYDAQFFSGTSASAPFVAGVAGLIKGIKHLMPPAQIKQILITAADPIQTGEPDKRIGTGCYQDPNDSLNTGCRLNALKAVCHGEVLGCGIMNL